jgi:succinyl-diaminopimelate desuccinylase
MEILKINSESYDRVEVTRALKEVMRIAQRMGFNTEVRANGEVGVVFYGEGEETLGILAHVDVVPFGEMESWTYSPYGERLDDKIYGRGIVDDKGMVIASLYAMAAVKLLNMPIYKKVELIVGTREEIVWDDIELYKKEGYKLPDYGFTPDGEFPIINREKGNCELVLDFKEKSSAGEFEIIDLKSGEAINSIPDKAYALIKGNIEIIKTKIVEYNDAHPADVLTAEDKENNLIMICAAGKAAHSSLPEQGDNALVTLCNFLLELNIGNTAVYKLFRFVNDNFHNNFFGELIGLPKHQEVINGETMGRTTVVPTMAYMDEVAHLCLSVRTVYGTSKDEVMNAFCKLSKNYGFSFKITDFLDPLYVPRNHKFIKILEEAYEMSTEKNADFILAGGTTYAKAMPNSVAFGPLFMGDIDKSHQKDEFIQVDQFLKATEIYALTVAKTLLSKDSLIKK